MPELVAFTTGAGGSVLVEAVDVGGGAVTRGRGGAGEVITRAEESLGAVLGRIGPVMDGIVDALRTRSDWPDEVEVEFAVKISTDSNVIIARAGGEANFRIRLKWSKPRDE